MIFKNSIWSFWFCWFWSTRQSSVFAHGPYVFVLVAFPLPLSWRGRLLSFSYILELSMLSWIFFLWSQYSSPAVIKLHFSAGKLLLMLGKVQFELQKLVDSYVSGIHVCVCVCSILQRLFDFVMNNLFHSSCY